MNIVDIIAKKRDALPLTAAEIDYWIRGVVSGAVADYQSAALLMAICINGFDGAETAALVKAMAESGNRVDLSDIPGVKADKHSTGGVGDKTSLVLMPVIAAAGLKGAKMSGRGLGHTGGTLDKLEAIPGFRTSLDIGQFKRQVREIGLAIVGQSGELAPADKTLYALRDVTATVDSIPLIAASIICKKLATHADVLVLDVKYGSGALIPDVERSRELARIMVGLAKANGIRASAVISSMEQPLGYAVGNALEVAEALAVLEGGGPADLRAVALALAGEQIYLAGLCGSREEAVALAEAMLDSGRARDKFVAMVRAQGGDDDFRRLLRAAHVRPYAAKQDGYLNSFQAQLLGQAAMLLGAGRQRKEDVIDPAAGLVLAVKAGARVQAGQTLLQLHYHDESRLEQALKLLDQAIVIGDAPIEQPPLIQDILS